MSVSDKERERARAKYDWSNVEKDLALSTQLNVTQATIFGRPWMEHVGIHPYDLVEWVHAFYRSGEQETPSAVAPLIRQAFTAGVETGKAQ